VSRISDDQARPPAPIRNLDYTILLCDDLAVTRAFYLETLKLPLEMDRATWVSFRVGASLLTLRPRGRGLAWEDGPTTTGSASIQLAFRVAPPEIDAWYAELQAKGVSILSPPRDLPDWRHRTLFFRDPENNIIELYAEI
jgi:catechol 2,3-dioxygenase-like lactoylglutathione lyase family enzyme